MVASKRKSRNQKLDAGAVHTWNVGLRALKCAVLYGANNSGKSNLIKSLRFFKRFVLDSSKESGANEPINVTPFLLSPHTEGKPSEFEIIFVHDEEIYQYNIAVTQEHVVDERLTRKSLKRNSSAIELFSRVGPKIKYHKQLFKEGKGLGGRTRSNALFLSVCANFDGPVSQKVLDFFYKIHIISGLNDVAALGWTAKKLNDPTWGYSINGLLRAFDLGIDRFEGGDVEPGFIIQEVTPADRETTEKISPAEVEAVNSELKGLRKAATRKVITYHKVLDDTGEFVSEIPFDLSANESAGTRRLVALAGPLVDTLSSGYILIVDEFESKLHSNITKLIVEIFNSNDGNPHGAQLVAATHDTNLLNGEHLRRDQVWFAGRDGLGRTSITSLVEYKVRNDASFEKHYLQGDYGGVPFINADLANIILAAGKNPQ